MCSYVPHLSFFFHVSLITSIKTKLKRNNPTFAVFLLTFHENFPLTQKMITIQKSVAHIRPTEDSKLNVITLFSLQNFENSPRCVRLINFLGYVSGSLRG